MQPSLDLIGIVVTDMARALAFYRALGLPIPPEADREPHVDVELPGGLRVAFDTVEVIRSFDPTYERPPSGRGGFVPAFSCASPAEVDTLYEELVGAGHTGHKEPWDAFWGQRYAEVLDPDGNLIDLFAPLS
jgi:catechol 2,3-dioxygenase-like lactoylglutathione lyase family enzyme